MKKIKLDIQRFSIPYTYLEFEDLPSTNTPINATNLNAMQDSIHEETQEDIKNAVTGDLVVDSIRTKNMLNTDGTMLGYTIDSSGNVIQFNYNAANPTLIKVKPNTKYTFSAKQNIYKLRFNEYNSNKTFIQRNEQEAQTYTITTTANTQYISWSINYNNQDTITQALLESLNLQIEEGSVATEYKPFQNLDKTLDIYSTSEIRIGTWIDGKPIYRKVLTGNYALNLGTNNIPHNISNLKKCINIIAFDDSGTRLPSLGDENNLRYGTNIRLVSSTNIEIRAINDTWASRPWYFILEYTKTTDV